MFFPFRRKNKSAKSLTATTGDGGWRILEYRTGAWQQGITFSREAAAAFPAVFSCVSLIAGDVSKLKPRIMRNAQNGVKTPVSFFGAEVLVSPNAMQTLNQFLEGWIASKLLRGNAYVLIIRADNGRIRALRVLNPDLVSVLVSESGDVFYQLGQDNLTGLTTAMTVPASEIIHDRFNCLYHPLIGLSPLTACGLAAHAGNKNIENTAAFFQNQSRPSGLLVAPGTISDETAARLKSDWETNYGGAHTGKVAVLGDDLKYVPMSLSPSDAQTIEQLKLSTEVVASCFHVPLHKIGGQPPSYNNVEALDQQYYSQCLQVIIEAIESLLDRAFALPPDLGVEFDLDGLLRMDTATKTRALAEGVKGGLLTPNEARARLGVPPLTGGDTIYMQEQYYSLEALNRRDTLADPFGAAEG